MERQSDPFKALADTTRRRILTLLKKRSYSAGEIADCFPRLSRPAVSRHLRVLREAGLVLAAGVGREQRYELAIATLARVHHDWFGQFDELWGTSLAALKKRAESNRGVGRSLRTAQPKKRA